MEIKRRIKMLVAANRRFIIHGRQAEAEPIYCGECGGATLTAEQTATFFNINQREIFHLIENGAIHFAETETGAVMICLSSIPALLQVSNNEQIPVINTTEEF